MTLPPRGDDPPMPPRAASGGHREPSRSSRGRATWTIVGVLLAIGVIGTLIVPVYARVTPKAGAFPFFYWYQLLWIPLVAILSWVCYLLVGRSSRRMRDASGPDEGRGDEPR
jgi:hypothetical protein